MLDKAKKEVGHIPLKCPKWDWGYQVDEEYIFSLSFMNKTEKSVITDEKLDIKFEFSLSLWSLNRQFLSPLLLTTSCHFRIMLTYCGFLRQNEQI